MNVAIITATGQQVEIIAVNGGWTTVHTLGADTREMKVRNGALSKHTKLSDTTAQLAIGQAAQAPKAAKAPRAKLPVEERKNGVVYSGYLPQYEAYTTVTKSGDVKRSIDKGDAVALALRPMTLEQVIAHVSKVTGISQVGLRERFGHLNVGMQRMNLGNMLRKALKETANA
jgi:hypothetical protein